MNTEEKMHIVADVLNVARDIDGISHGLKFDLFILQKRTTDEMIDRISRAANDLSFLSNHLIDLRNLMICRKADEK